MMNGKKIILVGLLAGLLTACGTQMQRAPVEDHNPVTASKGEPVTVAPAEPAPAAEESGAIYIVKKGDTLYRIALDKGQNYSDIVAWNNLANPNDIKVGQKLRVAPPDASASQNGVELHPVIAATSGQNNKSGPRADKRPYSDATLAEMQKSDTLEVPVGKTTTRQPDKMAENSSEPRLNDEIVWIWPTEGKVIANFDDNKNKGIDIAGKLGQDVVSAASGTVMYAGSAIKGLGNLVIIRHSDSMVTAYAHNRVILVKEKQIVSKGQKIAELGNSDSDSVKLHFELRKQGKPLDPLKYLPGR